MNDFFCRYDKHIPNLLEKQRLKIRQRILENKNDVGRILYLG